MLVSNSARVSSLQQVIRVLEGQGAVNLSVDKLQPELLGLNGYVGTRVQFKDERVERIWIRGLDVIQHAASPDKALVAEWLTLELSNQPITPVDHVIGEYLRMDIARGWPAMLRVALLSHSATNMGFLFDPLARTLFLPHDHPLADQIIMPTAAEVARYGRRRVS